MGQAQALTISALEATECLIGKDGQGHWVVRGPRGIYGELFVTRLEAFHFAMFENGNRPQAVVMVPGVLELDFSRKAA